MLETDVLIAGTGLAGAVTAVTAADRGKKVIIITKTDELLSGNTAYAQGGIIYKGFKDSPQKLKTDIMTAGDGHSWEPAVDQLVDMGPELIERLLIERFGVHFDMNSDNELDRTAEGAHSEPRIIHSKDKTGKTIQSAVLKTLEDHPNIEILKSHTIVDLLTLSHHSTNSLDIYKKPSCFGAFILNNNDNKVFPVFAGKTVLATGGIGRIYLHTTNPPESTGDGVALTWRAGARCFNLQYIQFHPTSFYNERDRFLLSESMRGEGARLIDANHKEFMEKFHPQGSLAPRDIVARSIHQTMLETGHPCVYLDISHKDSAWIKDRFPTIYHHCFKAGIDITTEPIPVVPAAHYSCGGVGVNLSGRTSLRRLYAIGEVSCTGVHGANRLASTSLLESLVWGYTAGIDVSKSNLDDDYFPDIIHWEDGTQIVDPALITQDWLNIKHTMWNYVGLLRNRQRLFRARDILRHLQSEVEHFYQQVKMTKKVIELRNGVQTALAVTSATLEAKESKGAHYLIDNE